MNATTEVTSVADGENDNDFRAWMKAMGFNAKQVALAGETIGMASAMAGRTARGERDLSDTERLAMAAVTANLPRWKPTNATEIEAVRTLNTMLGDELSKFQSDSEEDAIRTIRAVIRSEAHRLATEGRPSQSEDHQMDQMIRNLLKACQHSSAR